MSVSLNFDTEQLSSMELYSLQLQKVIADFTDFDAVTKAYVDDKVAQAKQELTDGASSALDTFKELEDYLTNSGVAGGLVEQINALSSAVAAEQARATGVESGLQTSLNDEISRATAKENALQSEVDATQVALGTNAVGAYQQSQASNYIATASSFKSADELLDAQLKVNADAIEAEQKRAYDEEQELQADIIAREALVRQDFASEDAKERTRAEGEESRIEAKVDAEISRAEGAEATLQASINSLTETQSSDNSALATEDAKIKWAVFGDNQYSDFGDLKYRYDAVEGNHYYAGTTGDPTLAHHVNELDRNLYYASTALGPLNSHRLDFGLPSPVYLRDDPSQNFSVAQTAVDAFKNINKHFESEKNSTLADRTAIRSEFASADSVIQGDLDTYKGTQAGVNSEAKTDRERIQTELDAQKTKQASEHKTNSDRLSGHDADISDLNSNLSAETTRAEEAESQIITDLNNQITKQDNDYKENSGRLDGHNSRLNGHDDDIKQLIDRPHDAVNGGFGIQHVEGSLENKYLYFSKSWRLLGSSDGKRLVFEYNKGDDVNEHWVAAVPFISHV